MHDAGVIRRFGTETALLIVDMQVGVDVLEYWGGGNGRRNNPGCEENAQALVADFRQAGLPVAWTLHDSREAASPLKLSLATGALKPGFATAAGEVVVTKDVNSAFVGTDLEVRLRRLGVRRLVVAGFFTNMCVETSVRMAGNMGYDTYLAPQACATTNRVGRDGVDRDPAEIHATSVANMDGEFCTALTLSDAALLLRADVPELQRHQGNE